MKNKPHFISYLLLSLHLGSLQIHTAKKEQKTPHAAEGVGQEDTRGRLLSILYQNGTFVKTVKKKK